MFISFFFILASLLISTQCNLTSYIVLILIKKPKKVFFKDINTDENFFESKVCFLKRFCFLDNFIRGACLFMVLVNKK